MKQAIRLVGIGHDSAGDDAVGIRVLREVAKKSWSTSLKLHMTSDPLRLLEWMEGCGRMILVDALSVEGRPGTVRRIFPEELVLGRVHGLSSHGIDVTQALQLGANLHGSKAGSGVEIIAITINTPCARSFELSPEVAAAIPSMVELIKTLV